MEDAISAPVDTGTAPAPAPEIAPAAPPAAPAADVQPAADAKPAFEKTPRGAVERAMAKLNGERERDPAGRFVPKDGQAAPPVTAAAPKPTDAPVVAAAPVAGAEPPPRYSPQAKADWATTPESVRAEVTRRETEMAAGIEKYRADATAFSELKEFDELAKSTGTTMKAAMTEYVGIERLLKQDPIAGFDKICGNMNLSLADVARHIVKALDGAAEPAPGAAATTPQDQVINELRQQITRLEGQVGKVSQTYESDRNVAALSPHVEAFAAKPENARFTELETDIIDILSGKGPIILPDKLQPLEKLSEAYRMASLLKPAPAPAPVVAAPPAAKNPDATAQTRRHASLPPQSAMPSKARVRRLASQS